MRKAALLLGSLLKMVEDGYAFIYVCYFKGEKIFSGIEHNM